MAGIGDMCIRCVGMGKRGVRGYVVRGYVGMGKTVCEYG